MKYLEAAESSADFVTLVLKDDHAIRPFVLLSSNGSRMQCDQLDGIEHFTSDAGYAVWAYAVLMNVHNDSHSRIWGAMCVASFLEAAA